MKKLKLIRDGMNLPFRLAPWGSSEETLHGVYRPLSRGDAADAQVAFSDLTGKARVTAIAAKLAERVKSWDCEDGPPSAENIAALPAAFFDALEMVVMGYSKAGADDEKKSESPQS